MSNELTSNMSPLASQDDEIVPTTNEALVVSQAGAAIQSPPAGDNVWITNISKGLPSQQINLDEEPVFTSDRPSEDIILAKVRAHSGRELERSDIEGIQGIACRLQNTKCSYPGAPADWTPPQFKELKSTEEIEEALPDHQAILYSTDDHHADKPQGMIIFLFDRLHSLEEFERVRAYLKETLNNDALQILDPLDPIPTPGVMTDDELFSEATWLHPLRPRSKRLSVDRIDPSFVTVALPHAPVVRETITQAEQAKSAREYFRKLPYVLEAFRQSDLADIIRSGSSRDIESLLGRCLARAIHNTTHAGPDTREQASHLVYTFLGSGAVGSRTPAVWDAVKRGQKQMRLRVPTWADFYEEGLPEATGKGIDPLADWEAAADRNWDPKNYLHVQSPGVFYRRHGDGRYDLSARIPKNSLYVTWRNLFPSAAPKEFDSFLGRMVQVVMQDAVFSSRSQIAEKDGVAVANLYVAPTIEPRPGPYPDIEAAIRNVVGPERNDDGYNYLLQWLAAPLQALNNGHIHKWHSMLVLQGIEGTGKGTLTKICRALFGTHNVMELDQARMENKFDPLEPNIVLAVGNEIQASRKPDSNLAEHIRRLVSDPTLISERKYKGAKEVGNYLNFILTTNNKNPVKLASEDRRVSVFKSTVRLPTKIAAAIDDDITGTKVQISAFYHALLQLPIKIAINDLFETEAKKDIIDANRTGAGTFARRLKTEGWQVLHQEALHAISTNGRVVPVTLSHSTGREYVTVDAMAAVAQYHCRTNGAVLPSSHELAAALKETLGATKERKRLGSGTNAVYTWAGIPLVVEDDGTVSRRSGDIAP